MDKLMEGEFANTFPGVMKTPVPMTKPMIKDKDRNNPIVRLNSTVFSVIDKLIIVLPSNEDHTFKGTI